MTGFITGKTHTCGELTDKQADLEVRLSGWVHVIRDMGGVIFIDLRDRAGLTQLVFESPQTPEEVLQQAGSLKTESTVTVNGRVRNRSNPNPELATGRIEVVVSEICVHVTCPTLPFEVASDQDVNLETRMTWRFLDLRRAAVAPKLPFRHQVIRAIRNQCDEEGFVDVETPILFKSTPEGARDYVVPSRLHAGKFYALPQSPQTLKQVLMSAGLEKYYQIARCFRDENLRGDRQPEFSQFDMEMSFITPEDVFGLIERIYQRVFKDVMGQELPLPFPRLSYDESIRRFGHDAPDTRFGLEHVILNDAFRDSPFTVISKALGAGGDLRVMAVPQGAKLSRKEIDGLTEVAKDVGAGGLLWIKKSSEGLTGPVAKHLNDQQIQVLETKCSFSEGDLILAVADHPSTAAMSLHKVRLAVAEKLELIPKDTFAFNWIVDFPLFEEDDDGKITYNHHPFVFPRPDDHELMNSDPLKVRAWSYDITLNGWELGSGSVRNHDVTLQKKILSILGMKEEDMNEQFGFLFRALEYGAPPHGGIAFGIDRLVTLLGQSRDIREYIAFPKTHKGTDLFTECPSEIANSQLDELHLSIRRASKGN